MLLTKIQHTLLTIVFHIKLTIFLHIVDNIAGPQLIFSNDSTVHHFWLQLEYFGYQKLVQDKNLSHVIFLLGIAVLFWVMDRQVIRSLITLWRPEKGISRSPLQHEYLRRLDYQWKRQLKSEQFQASITKLVNRALLQNILPMHVGNVNNCLMANRPH